MPLHTSDRERFADKKEQLDCHPVSDHRIANPTAFLRPS
jgi:hypothetical protein